MGRTGVMRRFLILLTAVMFFGSCVSLKKQRDRAHNYFRDHPEELAELCADKFDPQTEYLPGDTIVKSDTTVVTDTVVVEIDCPDGSKVKAPPAKKIYIRDSVFVRDTIKVENTARVEQYRLQSEREARLRMVAEALMEQERSKATRRGWWIAILSAGMGVYLFIKLRGRII